VDCATGLFINREVDLEIPDVIPLRIIRAYRPQDTASRAFGIGTNLNLDMFLVGTSVNTNTSGGAYTYQDLILANGSHIHFPRISSGTSWADAIYQNSSAPGVFYGATLSWDSGGGVCEASVGVPWVMLLKNGTRYCFPDSNGATTPGAASVVGVIDRNGNTLTMVRDGNFNLTKITSPNGRNLTLAYDTSNRITLVTDDIGRTVQYAYDSAGRLATVTDPASNTRKYTYDSNNNLLTIIDKRGNTQVTNTYDANNRVVKQVYPDGTSSTWAYTVTNSSATQAIYDVCTGQPTTLTGPYGDYNVPCVVGLDGQVTATTFTNRRGAVDQYTFNTFGFPVTLVKSVGKVEQQSYVLNRDPNTNLLTSTVDALNRTTAYLYDSIGDVTKITWLSGTSSAVSASYTFDPIFAQLVKRVDPLGHFWTLSLDQSGNAISVTNALGYTTNFVYDSQGRLLSSSDPLGHANTRAFSGPDIQTSSNALSETTQFDHDQIGRLRASTDPLKNGWFLTYDSLNRIAVHANPQGKTIQVNYDQNGNSVSEIDESSHSTSSTFDAMNRIITAKNPLSAVISYTYEPGGLLNQTIDPKGQLSGRTYDSLGRATQIGFGATAANPTAYKSTVAFTWDAGNRSTKLVDSVTGTITRTFDGFDRMTQEVTPQGTVAWTYDAAGRRSTMTVTGEPTLTYTYDNADRLTQINQAAGTTNGQVEQTIVFTYDKANRRTTMILANGISVGYGYDNANELTGITYTNKGGTVLGTITYSYDAAGRRIAVGGTLVTTGSAPAAATLTNNVANELSKFNSDSLSYDADGELTSDGTHTYVWDERNRLVSISGGITASFTYDSFDRRTSKTVGSTTTGFVYDGQTFVQELAGTTNAAAVLYNLVAGSGVDEQLLRMPADGAAVYNILADALGSTVEITDQTGASQATFTYDPYGNTTQSGTTDQSQQYSGRENDGTGLYFYRARYYSPKYGRFITEDSMGWASGQTNEYAYVGGNPISSTDPFGHQQYMCGAAGLPAWCPAPPNPGPARYVCFQACMNVLNPYWTTPAGGVLGAISQGLKAQGGAAAASGVAGACEVIGTVASGWAIGTAVGCTMSCTANPSSYP
jgi:RHS repeat-associated protein